MIEVGAEKTTTKTTTNQHTKNPETLMTWNNKIQFACTIIGCPLLMSLRPSH